MSVFIEMRTIILFVFFYLASSASSEEVRADRNVTLRAHIEDLYSSVDDYTKPAIYTVVFYGVDYDDFHDFQRYFEKAYSVCSVNGESILCPDVQQLKASNPNYTLVDVIQLLVDEGADINAKEKSSQQTALHSIISTYNLLPYYDIIKFSAVIKKLIENGADVNATDNLQSTPLHIACDEARSSKIVEMLLQSHSDINAKDHMGRTPLMIAAERYSTANTEIVKLLLEYNADVNVRDEYGRSAVIYALSARCIEHAELILKKNVDIYAKDVDGKTVCDFAESNYVRSLIGCSKLV